MTKADMVRRINELHFQIIDLQAELQTLRRGLSLFDGEVYLLGDDR